VRADAAHDVWVAGRGHDDGLLLEDAAVTPSRAGPLSVSPDQGSTDPVAVRITRIQ
jgi:hypothetical protein